MGDISIRHNLTEEIAQIQHTPHNIAYITQWKFSERFQISGEGGWGSGEAFGWGDEFLEPSKPQGRPCSPAQGLLIAQQYYLCYCLLGIFVSLIYFTTQMTKKYRRAICVMQFALCCHVDIFVRIAMMQFQSWLFKTHRLSKDIARCARVEPRIIFTRVL